MVVGGGGIGEVLDSISIYTRPSTTQILTWVPSFQPHQIPFTICPPWSAEFWKNAYDRDA